MIRIWFNRRKKYTKNKEELITRDGAGLNEAPIIEETQGSDEPLTAPRINMEPLNLYSRALSNPEIIYTIVMNLVDTRLMKISIDSSSNAVGRLLSQVRVPPQGPYYIYATSDGAAIRMLVSDARLIGVLVEDGPRTYQGLEALEELGRMRGTYNASVSRINTLVAKWSPEYSVGIGVLDTQHMEFFKTINSIFESIVSGRFHEKGEAIMKGLLGYTRGHFKSEEAIMDKYNYPGLDEHMRHHKLFTHAVISYYDSYVKEPQDISLAGSVFAITRGWLKDHILTVDKRYEEYFKRLGIRVED